LEARLAAEAQLKTVFDHIDDVIYVADPETYELLFINKAAKNKFGGQIEGQKCHKALQGLDEPCVFCTNPMIFGPNLGKDHRWEFHNTHVDNWFGIKDRAIRWHDGRMVRFEHARDITEQKKAEIERENYRQTLELAVTDRTRDLARRSQELEVANRDLEGFSYSVSHDLRAPLRAIDGFISILRDGYGEKFDGEGQRLFSIVQENARKMGELIDDILAFSRAGRLELDKQTIDMNQLLKSVWFDLNQSHADKHIAFDCAELPSVDADPNAIRQVFINLLSNAIKFSSGRDPIEISVNGQIIDGRVRYTVQDNGVGFNDQYKDKLFTMFQRLHGMDEFEGTGVGLAIVKRFVQKHGGEVGASGTPGGGASFWFELPVDSQSAHADAVSAVALAEALPTRKSL
jgi:signal transduction histidine kinase